MRYSTSVDCARLSFIFWKFEMRIVTNRSFHCPTFISISVLPDYAQYNASLIITTTSRESIAQMTWRTMTRRYPIDDI